MYGHFVDILGNCRYLLMCLVLLLLCIISTVRRVVDGYMPLCLSYFSIDYRTLYSPDRRLLRWLQRSPQPSLVGDQQPNDCQSANRPSQCAIESNCGTNPVQQQPIRRGRPGLPEVACSAASGSQTVRAGNWGGALKRTYRNLNRLGWGGRGQRRAHASFPVIFISMHCCIPICCQVSKVLRRTEKQRSRARDITTP